MTDESLEKKLNESNIIELEKWKQTHELENADKSLKRYFNVLDFHELISESESLANEISKDDNYSQRLAKQSKVLIHELSRRIGPESLGLSYVLSNMVKKIESKLKNISKH